jgi:hypothetical protein
MILKADLLPFKAKLLKKLKHLQTGLRQDLSPSRMSTSATGLTVTPFLSDSASQPKQDTKLELSEELVVVNLLLALPSPVSWRLTPVLSS